MKTQYQMGIGGMLVITLSLFASLSYGGDTARVSVSTAGTQGSNNSFLPSLTENGQVVAFHSFKSNLVDGDTNGERDVFVRNRETGEMVTVRRTWSGVTPLMATRRSGS